VEQPRNHSEKSEQQRTAKHDIQELHNRAILGTARILRDVLMWRYRMFILGKQHYCSYRTAATVRTFQI